MSRCTLKKHNLNKLSNFKVDARRDIVVINEEGNEELRDQYMGEEYLRLSMKRSIWVTYLHMI